MDIDQELFRGTISFHRGDDRYRPGDDGTTDIDQELSRREKLEPFRFTAAQGCITERRGSTETAALARLDSC
jgi:hypothetical protein